MNGISMLGQSSTASSGPPPPAQRTPVDLPIDGSVYLLLIAGVLYGIYMIRRKKRVTGSPS